MGDMLSAIRSKHGDDFYDIEQGKVFMTFSFDFIVGQNNDDIDYWYYYVSEIDSGEWKQYLVDFKCDLDQIAAGGIQMYKYLVGTLSFNRDIQQDIQCSAMI